MDPVYLWYIDVWVKVLGTVAAIGGGAIAAWKAIAEWKRSTLQRADELKQRGLELEQRKQEFRQKQALFARDIIRDIQEDKRATDALMMLDFRQYHYVDAEKDKTHFVSRIELQRILRMEPIPEEERDPDKETFVRRCFERLYDHLEQIDNLLAVEVLNIADLESTFRYYMQSALDPDVEHTWFFKEFEYPGAEHFMRTLGSGTPKSPSRCRSKVE